MSTFVYPPSPGGGGGAVDSVNGQTGVVVLDADDVGAASQALDNLVAPVVNTDIDMGANSITNMADPVSAQDAATKQYVDDEISGITFPVDSVNGQTGVVVLDAADVGAATVALDNLVAPVVNVSIDMDGNTLENLPDPTTDQQAATKKYVDDSIPAAGANTALSNLASTNINADLVPDVDVARYLGNAGKRWNIYSNSIDSDTGDMYIRAAANMQLIVLNGLIDVTSSAPVTMKTLNSGSASESMTIASGSAGGASASGNASVISGAPTDGAGGNVVLRTEVPTGSGTRGTILFQNGSEGTTGHVWTSTGTNGEGEWQAAGGGGATTELDNLTTTAINADLLPDADVTRSLGSASLRWFLNSTYIDSGASSLSLVSGSNLNVNLAGGTLSFQQAAATIIKTADTGAGASENLILTTGGAGSGGATGALQLRTANNDQAAGSGAASLFSGNGAGGGDVPSGAVSLFSGDSSGTSPSGLVTIRDGAPVDGAGGGVVIRTSAPTGSGTRGIISLRDGSEGTAGHVWTSTGTSGEGEWQAVAAPVIVAASYRGQPTGTIDTSGTQTTTLPTLIVDTHSAYSGGTYTVPVTGIYNVSAQLAIESTQTTLPLLTGVSIANNGTVVASNYVKQSGDNDPAVRWPQVQTVLSLTAGDLITVKNYADGTSLSFASIATWSNFSIVKVN